MDTFHEMRHSVEWKRGRQCGVAMECRCSREKILAVHRYLKEHFPDCALRDFHEATRLKAAGLSVAQDDHHVVSITRNEVLPYYAVLLNDFQEYSVQEIEQRLRAWNFADVVRGNRIAIASTTGASTL